MRYARVVGAEEREGEGQGQGGAEGDEDGDERDEGGHMSTGDGEGGSDESKECP